MATIVGTAGPDTLQGGPGADSISAGDGSDQIFGRGGADILAGGGGADIFTIGLGESSTSAALGLASNLVHIIDWSSADKLVFTGEPAGDLDNAIGIQASDLGAALSQADNLFTYRPDTVFVIAEVGPDLIVIDSQHDAVVLSNRTFADINPFNIANGVSLPPPPPPPPVTPGVNAAIDGNLDAVHLSHLIGTAILTATPTSLVLSGSGVQLTLTGVDFTYDANEQITGGTVHRIDFVDLNASGKTQGFIYDLAIPVTTLSTWMFADASTEAFSTLFSGSDTIGGSSFGDLIRGFDGNDVLYGFGGSDTLYGGAGDDTITVGVSQGGDSAGPGPTYLRGDEGDDVVSGGSVFDDINGNMGNDTLHGNNGDDWVVGGKDNDVQFGDAGNDVVWGNLGNDTLDGGDGNDQVRGGQGDDVVNGGAGDDFVSGDRGNDTISGGAGADLFHGSQDAGIDRVLDFHLSEGDRVMLDPGTTYTVSQVGADTVIDMGGGNQMILVGVQLSTLTPGWIFEG